ncbi:MAG: hypothetical protein ACKV22_02790 [Bryobacteraceae bacterium]
MFACLIAPGVAASKCAEAFSPRYEEVDGNTVIVDISGLHRLYGPPQQVAEALQAAANHAEARVGVAAHREAAIHAARGFRGVTVLPPGEEAGRLGGLAVELLDPSPELLATLDCWGIRTFRDLAHLPEIGLAERLGQEGVRLQKLARCEPLTPLQPVKAELSFAASAELDHEVDSLEPLSFVLARLLHDVCARLESHALAALVIRVILQLEDRGLHTRELRLPVPMANPRTFLKLLQLDLAAHPPSKAVIGVTVEMEPAKPRSTQEGLFTPPTPEPEKLELTLARLAALVGAGNVGSPKTLDTHRPGAFEMTRPLPVQPSKPRTPPSVQLAFRVCRPPIPAQVRVADGQPVSVQARGVRGHVVSCAGPWRTSGDWWTPNAWARDDWDIALSDGALYRLFSEHSSGRWFVEGRYD